MVGLDWVNSKLMRFICLFWLLTTTACLADWPEFRGPNADGTVKGELPTKWSESKNVTWRTAIRDRGWSTPVVGNDKIWLTTAKLNGRTMSVLCLDYKTGDILLDQVLVYCDNPEPLLKGQTENSYATCSPVLEGNRVYISFGSYGTFCLDTDTDQIIWVRRDIRCSHWRGPASSPIIHRNKLILTFDGTDQQFLLALDKLTGRTLWRSERSVVFNDDKNGRPANSGDQRKGYGTPIIIRFVNQNYIMVSNSSKACYGYNPDTGDELWKLTYRTHSPSSRPIFCRKTNNCYINTGLPKPEVWGVKIDPRARGDITNTHVQLKLFKRTPKRSSPVLVNGLLFFANSSIGSCVDLETGDELWAERMGGEYSASLISANDYVYFFDENGLCTVVRASDEFEKIAENQLDSGMMASPVAYQGSLLLRTKTHLYRIDSKE